MPALRQFIESYTDLSDDEWGSIQQSFSRKEFRKNEMILTEGEVCRYFYFIEEGLVRFFIHNEGDDITKFFTFAPYCFTSYSSYREQCPAHENIQAIERCIVWRMPIERANGLLLINGWANFSRRFLREVQQHTEALLMDAKVATAEERYQQLMARYPMLVQRIPLRHLSTFLGVAPQSLSRIRRKYINSLRT